ncbi:hypothetical protein DRA42_13765 [Ethanoligenens harbinense]|nr:hypothetical protein CXQ68_13715 [Ethanoligenens harbinense YUAN-3]AYF39832.1 hypothetical protein CXP51_13615 [Ethanoligenens harbinense]AYF42664.1 hypothetical protein CN246_14195 [Ethanoligenens harbinense]QCN93413.1 hypothetical protein DRA42_13765 [Ethanoligenens harbinense]
MFRQNRHVANSRAARAVPRGRGMRENCIRVSTICAGFVRYHRFAHVCRKDVVAFARSSFYNEIIC